MKSNKLYYFFAYIFLVGIITNCCIMQIKAEAQEVTIRLHCWSGYAKPYVEDFKKFVKNKYNIDVSMIITNASAANEFWELARGKEVDIISPAHNIPMSPTWSFVSGKILIPIDMNNIPNYKYVLPILQKNKFILKNNNIYAIPYTMGAYGLAYNSEKVKEPESWNILWKEKSKKLYTITKDYADCNIYISSLALGVGYKMLYDIDKLRSLPSVGINGLTVSQLRSSILQKKLNSLAENAYSLWKGTANPDEFDKLSYATTWGHAVHKANIDGLKWKMARPKEGSTMWVDHWAITYAVRNDPLKKKLCEGWINFCLSQDLQIGVIRNWGASPVVTNINELLTKEDIKAFNVGDNEYWKTLSFWEHQNKRTTNTYKLLWENAMKLRK